MRMIYDVKFPFVWTYVITTCTYSAVADIYLPSTSHVTAGVTLRHVFRIKLFIWVCVSCGYWTRRLTVRTELQSCYAHGHRKTSWRMNFCRYLLRVRTTNLHIHDVCCGVVKYDYMQHLLLPLDYKKYMLEKRLFLHIAYGKNDFSATSIITSSSEWQV